MTHYITYEITHHSDGIEADEVSPDHGATQSIVVGSILHPPPGESGGSSTAIVTLNGYTNEPLSPEELFKFWTMMAHDLSQSLPKGARRNLCTTVFDRVKEAVLAGRNVDTELEARTGGDINAEDRERTS